MLSIDLIIYARHSLFKGYEPGYICLVHISRSQALLLLFIIC